MPIITLLIKADIENVASLIPEADINWSMKVKCSNCGEISGNAVYISSTESQSTGRGSSNLVMRCKLCRRENSVDIVKGSLKNYSEEDNGKWIEIAQFDCRGFELLNFEFINGWTVVSTGGTRYENIDLSQNEWVEYDSKLQNSVGIYNITGKFN